MFLLENISPAVGTYDVSSGLLGTGHRFLKSDRWKEGMSPPPDTLIGEGRKEGEIVVHGNIPNH